MARFAAERWHRIPRSGPIADVLRDRQDWLEALSGSAGARRQGLSDLADGGRTEDRIRQGYTGRAAIELLQNAHDAMAEAGIAGSVSFVATADALLVANEGQEFDAARVRSIARLGSSEKAGKRGKHHQIGYKGIGFTSVFEVSDRPQILSREVGFKFDRAEATALVESRLGQPPDGPVPARYFPLPLRDAEIEADREILIDLFRAGAATVVRLPFRHDLHRTSIIDSLIETLVPEMLLFMPTIRSLTFRDGERQVGWTQRTSGRTGEGGVGRLVHLDALNGSRTSWLVATGSVPISRKVVEALDDSLWTGISALNVAAALPWGEKGPREDLAPSRLHSYFPTDDELGRALLLHADFYLDSTRRRIATRGPGKDVTRVATEGTAALAATLVESVAGRGAAVLEACVQRGRQDGAGEMIGKILESALRTRKIARRFRGGLARPDAVVRLGLDLPRPTIRKLAGVLDPATDLLNPDDDRGGVRALLLQLGADRLEPTDVAQRVDMRRWKEGYAAGLGLLGEWLATTGLVTPYVLLALADRHVVQDEGEAWVRASEVERRAASAPDLPPALRRRLVKEPGTASGRAFLDALEIPKLNARSALERLLDAIDAGSFGRNDQEKDDAIELAFRVWRSNPDAVREEKHRVGSIDVRCRTATAVDGEVAWLAASDSYFSNAWLDSGTLEDLYGPDDLVEFIAEAPSVKPADRDGRRAFLSALGVSATPKELPFAYGLAGEWLGWQAAVGDDPWSCDMGHVNRFEVDGTIIERLDQILDRIEEPGTATALVRALATLKEPFGPSVKVRCAANQHRGMASVHEITGYQRWRLTTVPWVPVGDDPGGAVLQVPSRAWRGLPRGSRIMVPRARVRAEDAERLGLVHADKPGLEAVEAALRALATAFSRVEEAPADVTDTAIWLMQRLERTVARGDRPRRSAPPFLSTNAAGSVWSKMPVVSNVPGMPRMPGIDVLPPGRWQGLQRCYGLKMARDLVIPRAIAGPRRITDFVLPHSIRGALLSILLRRGADADRTASRISAIVERPVATLRVVWTHGEVEVEQPDATFVLELRRDTRSRLIGADLVWLAGHRPDPISLGAAIAEYLDLPELEGDIGLFLTNSDRVTELRAVTRGELDDADRLLRQRKAYEAREEPDWAAPSQAPNDLDDALNPDHWSPPTDGEAGVQAAIVEATRDYPDISSARFGASRTVGGGRRRRPEADAAARPRPGEPVTSRARPMPLPGDAERAATASGRMTELTAIELVTKIGRGLPGVEQVIDVQDQNRGWDLEFRMRSGSVIPVEVKGSSGSAPFVISANEWAAAREHANYVLYHVVDITTPGRMRVRRFLNLGTNLSFDLVSSAGWAVTGWRDLQPDEMDVELE